MWRLLRLKCLSTSNIFSEHLYGSLPTNLFYKTSTTTIVALALSSWLWVSERHTSYNFVLEQMRDRDTQRPLLVAEQVVRLSRKMY